MEIIQKCKCVEYGIDDRGWLFLRDFCGGFDSPDSPDNRDYMNNMFHNWAASISVANCCNCRYRQDCRYFDKK